MAIYKGNIKLDANGTLTSSVPTGSILQYDGNTIPAGYEEVNGFDNYSTTEQRIGTWIDGKPLYRKIIQGTVPTVTTDNTGVQSTIDITNLNADKVFLEWGYVYSSQYDGIYPIPVYRGQTLAVRLVITLPAAITIWAYNTLYNNNDIILSLLYTKSTDNAS